MNEPMEKNAERPTEGRQDATDRTDSLAGIPVDSGPPASRQRLGGKYPIIQTLGGEGKTGMGIVYICHDTAGNYVLALKTYQDRFFTSPEIKSAFLDEALTWIHMGAHPNIVQAFQVENLVNKPYIILEPVAPFIENQRKRHSLADFLQDSIPLARILDWGVQVCHGMEHAVTCGLVAHRDIKPENLLITRDNVVKITDFGIASSVLRVDAKNPWKIRSTYGGTPFYTAPEGQVDIRSDIFSFGRVLNQLADPSPSGDRDAFATGVADPMNSKQRAGVHPILLPVIERCLQPHPEERYHDFRELRGVLEDTYSLHTGKKPYAPNIKHGSTDSEKRDLLRRQWNVRTYINIGLDSTRNKNRTLLDTALEENRALLQRNPDDPDTLHDMGMGLAKQGHLDDAIACFRKALQIRPDMTTTRNNLAIALRTKGNYKEAIEEYRIAISRDPGNAECHYNLGVLYLARKQIHDSIAEFIQAGECSPEYAKPKVNLGLAYLGLGMTGEAIDALEKALTLRPDCAAAYWNLGLAHEKRGDARSARGAFEAFVRCAREGDPDIPRAKKEIERLRFIESKRPPFHV